MITNQDTNYNIIKVGSFSLTINSIIILIIGALLFLYSIFNKQYSWNLVYFLLLFLLLAYDVNCLILGSCNIWSHIVTFINICLVINIFSNSLKIYTINTKSDDKHNLSGSLILTE